MAIYIFEAVVVNEMVYALLQVLDIVGTCVRARNELNGSSEVNTLIAYYWNFPSAFMRIFVAKIERVVAIGGRNLCSLPSCGLAWKVGCSTEMLHWHPPPEGLLDVDI
jgi:hypothetical protein